MYREVRIADGYVRIPISELSTIRLRHLVSEKDTSIAVMGVAATITGISEWVGPWRNRTVSLGWDWAVIDGLVVLVNPGDIRTNIQLVSHEGEKEPPGIMQIQLFHWIESLPWREGALRDLLSVE